VCFVFKGLIFYLRTCAPVHAMKAYWGNKGTAPVIPNLDTSWMWVVNFTLRPVFLGKGKRYLLSKRLGGSQNESGRFVEKRKTSWLVTRFEPRTVQSVASRTDYASLAALCGVFTLQNLDRVCKFSEALCLSFVRREASWQSICYVSPVKACTCN
jgi:hypothetical protein